MEFLFRVIKSTGWSVRSLNTHCPHCRHIQESRRLAKVRKAAQTPKCGGCRVEIVASGDVAVGLCQNCYPVHSMPSCTPVKVPVRFGGEYRRFAHGSA